MTENSALSHANRPGHHKFGVGSLQYSFLVLDDAGFGLLDTGALAF